MGLLHLFACSVLITVVGAQELSQEIISVTAVLGREVSIHCTHGTGCVSYIHWYQKKEGENFKRVLYIDINSGAKTNDPGYKEFQAEKNGNTFTLKMQLKSSHAAEYYCACWVVVSGTSVYIKRFGTGTRLLVSDQTPKPPKVSVYSTVKAQGGKNTLMCHASDMFPGLVRLSWKKRKNNNWDNVVAEDGEVLELSSDEKRKTSMMIIDRQKAKPSDYACSYAHEAKDQGKESQPLEIKEKAQGPQAVPTLGPPILVTCPPPDNSTSQTDEQAVSIQRGLYLAMWVYTLMIVKGMAYFCAISYFLCRKHMEIKLFRNTMDMKMSK